MVADQRTHRDRSLSQSRSGAACVLDLRAAAGRTERTGVPPSAQQLRREPRAPAASHHQRPMAVRNR